MHRRLLLTTVACLVVAACGAEAASPSSVPAPSARQTPSVSPGPPASASMAPAPMPTPGESSETTAAPTATRSPDKAWRGDAEAALPRGVREDIASTCRAATGDLPKGVLAELRCTAPSDGVRLVTLRVYASRWELLDAWDAMVAARGIEPMSHGGRCRPRRASEGGYVPGDGHGIEVADRSACWVARDGTAHYLATIPSFVLVRVDGLEGVSIPRLEAWAWLGNRDQPGNPTLWHGRR